MPGEKRVKSRFVGIPYQVVNTEYFAKLSPHANKLLIDMSLQRNGRNNGALSACWTLMAKRGWKSCSTLHRAVTELIGAGFIVVTRRGMKIRGRPTLYALTWDGIDDCNIRFDAGITPHNIPLSHWCRDARIWCNKPVRLVQEKRRAPENL